METYMIIGAGILFFAFLIWRFALALHEGALFTGVFLGKFQEVNRRETPAKFYFLFITRLVISTLAILGILWLMRDWMEELLR